ncbi:MAG: hypothetical protein JKX85_16330 [Phycisphaeraceae bacterium]|nr:hypothetical protein [Phycisphaeraceae bacterium]
MDVALPSFILGYHGCDVSTAEEVFAGRGTLKPSKNQYDWLGNGIYFWEHNAQRAGEFAKQMRDTPHPSGQKITTPAVVGAIIDLGFCLNLLDSRYIEMVGQSYQDIKVALDAVKKPLPQNTGGKDRVSRKLDCAVIESLHKQRKKQEEPSFDTVRAAFFEGPLLYENAGFSSGNHIQVCVRDHQSIVGYFRPLNEKGKPLSFR